ncbi:hypothetical protein [Spiractinospora alimapuensis]|nr:hypothetical protein [Spiractinospora alimapuensis]
MSSDASPAADAPPRTVAASQRRTVGFVRFAPPPASIFVAYA